MIHRLLVANRGEIARRVFASCRRLGIETVAVHSDADAALPFVSEADYAVRLPGNAPGETYLRGDLVIEAARKAGADAIHPGYGFLSENADFARQVEEAGLTWVGPAPESIVAMGSKIEAKRLMKDAGVPILEDDGTFPVLVKASAGGGGRGMRIVHRPEDLDTEVALASSEAESAFGDGTVFVEPYVENSRHVEVQVVGDPAGGRTHVLGERDCTVQRRHQKVVEEAPAPGLTDEVRRGLHEAARAASDAIGYRGAGTVEFLVDAEDPSRFFFLEMNTRLQVEHPVTEAVTGLDLVELQLAVAEGRSIEVEEGATRGHAIEVRLYAEDPAHDYQPQSGPLVTLEVPGTVAEFSGPTVPGVRLDAGFESGSEVSTHYDAMLAKVIAWGATREQATRALVTALRRARIHGVRTNRDQLIEILSDPAFADMTVTTSWLGTRESGAGKPDVRLASVAAALTGAEHAAAARRVQQGIPVAWRNVVSQPQRSEFIHGDEQADVEWWGGRDGYVVDGLTVVEATPRSVVLEVDGVQQRAEVSRHGDQVFVDLPGGSVTLHEVPRFTDPADEVASGSLLAPMPGTVVKIGAEVGQDVEAGDVVLVLEAMKMQHTVTAPHAGTVTELRVEPGTQVASGEVLAVVSEAESEGDDQ